MITIIQFRHARLGCRTVPAPERKAPSPAAAATDRVTVIHHHVVGGQQSVARVLPVADAVTGRVRWRGASRDARGDNADAGGGPARDGDSPEPQAGALTRYYILCWRIE